MLKFNQMQRLISGKRFLRSSSKGVTYCNKEPYRFGVGPPNKSLKKILQNSEYLLILSGYNR